MIDQGTIARIFDTAEITDVVQDFITLKKRGVNYLGLCPFHNEKTPSFTVSPAKGIYKCFGCGKGGNSVNFVMEHEQLSYPEALKWLAKKYNIEIVEKELTEDEKKEEGERESLMIVSSYAQKYFTETFKSHKDGIAIAQSYFKERGYREDIIEKFQLGYCLDKQDAFTHAAKEKGYKLDFLVKTGLTIQKNVETYDRFRGRVMFPIHGISGNVIAFGGRTLKTDKKIAKYLNSPESPIYHKSNVLYGIFFAKKTMVSKDMCYLVEGYTDVISLHQAGIENVVSSSGTSLTVEQIRLIRRFTKNITVLYDGDDAGIKASLRGIDLLLEEGLNVKVLLFPEGDDPDSFSKKMSASDLSTYLDNHVQDFITFKAQLLLGGAVNDPVKKANLITDIIRTVSIIPDGIKRSVYIKECGTLLQVDEKVLFSEINKIRRKKSDDQYKKEQRKEQAQVGVEPQAKLTLPKSLYDLEEKEIIRLLLLYGQNILFDAEEEENKVSVATNIIKEIKDDDLEFSTPIYKQIFEEYEHLLFDGKEVKSNHFINHADNSISTLAAGIFSPLYTLSKIYEKDGASVETEEMKLKELVPKAINEYKIKAIIYRIKDIEKAINQAQKENKNEGIADLMQQYMVLNELKVVLSEKLGNRTII